MLTVSATKRAMFMEFVFALLQAMCGVGVDCAYSDLNMSNITRNTRFSSEKEDLLRSLARLPRLLSFQTLDDDLKIDLEFAVPFIKVPVKKAEERATSMSKSFANVNISALVVSALLVIAAVSVGSIISTGSAAGWGSFNPFRSQKMMNLMDPVKFSYKDSRGVKSETSIHELFEGVENLFQSDQIDLTNCIQKAVCLLVKNSSEMVDSGRGLGAHKIIDGTTSLRWFLNVMDGTAIKDAIDAGKSYQSCKYKYQQCIWQDQNILDMLNEYLQVI